MNNMASKIKNHNNNILYRKEENETARCNCPRNKACPLDGNCLTTSLVYEATVTTLDDQEEKKYRGSTGGAFKDRFPTHTASFRHEKYKTSTRLSKYIWELKEGNRPYNMKWSKIASAQPYQNGSKRCNLCLTEKLLIINGDENKLLNKRSDLISKCRHENKYYLMNYPTSYG